METRIVQTKERAISSSESKACKNDEPLNPRTAAYIKARKEWYADFDENYRKERKEFHSKLRESWRTIL